MFMKVTVYALPDLVSSAARAAVFASRETDFSRGFSVIQQGEQTFYVKKNKAGFTVWQKQ